ncbi:MAG: tetratricopeptide (TPR) repeat protein [Sphingobacteriales bacterium]|jgi:tetratricopeptide (TPR) repeat protein
MDNIKEIVKTLSSDDLKEFRIFCNRQKRIKNRMDLKLFDVLCEEIEYKPSQIIDKLYESKNPNAYHAVRKRLVRNLTYFIMLKRMDNDNTSASSIMGAISLARYLFDHRSHRLAWGFLKKAEDQAINNEQFELLNGIYNLMIEYNSSSGAPDLDVIINRREKNKKLANEDEKALIAHALISKKLQEHKLNGNSVDFNRLIKKVIKDLELSETVLKRPKVLFNMVSIVRSGSLASKDFKTFEPYIIETYEAIKNRGRFSESTHYYKVQLLYMIAHVLYRNRKFEESIIYLKELEENLNAYKKVFFLQFYPKYLLLVAAANNYLNKLPEAVEILSNALSDKSLKIGVKDQHNIILNLAVYHFNGGDFASAVKTIISFPKSDSWIEKRLGKEWLIRKNLIELIIQYELGNHEIALKRINAMNKHFREMFASPIYGRAKIYMDFIKEFINDPEWVKKVGFFRKAKPLLKKKPNEQEDTQAMAFYCWLISKKENKAYYEVLLSTVNQI